MTVKDAKGVALRKAVARRTQRFFAEWFAQLSSGTAEIWNRIESQLASTSHRSSPGSAPTPPPVTHRMPMQQQPVQQQQTKISDDKSKG
jgi:hypothetical protein